MRYTTTCECCGHQVTAFTHKLNKGLVKALRSLVDFYEKHKTTAELGELDLTTQQYSNFQKLQYFKLVFHDKNAWGPTPLGKDFIEGVVPVTTTAANMGRKTLEYNHEAWDTHTAELETLFVHQIDEGSYKKRPEYVEEKTRSLFNE